MPFTLSFIMKSMPFRIFAAFLLAESAWAGNITYSLKAADGATHTEAEIGRMKATVFIFVATDCPNSNTYAPVLAHLYRQYSPRGVAFFGVYSDPSETAASINKHDRDFSIPYPALLDAHQTLARETGARSTPEVVVLGPDGHELYRGRVDNRFIAVGKTRFDPTENDLRDALEAIMDGKPVPHPVTRTIGCAIPGLN